MIYFLLCNFWWKKKIWGTLRPSFLEIPNYELGIKKTWSGLFIQLFIFLIAIS